MTVNQKLCRNITIQYFKQHMFGVFSWIASQRQFYQISKTYIYEEIRIKHGFCYISFCSLRILYNSKFILMVISLGTNAVIVTRVHCIFILYFTSVSLGQNMSDILKKSGSRSCIAGAGFNMVFTKTQNNKIWWADWIRTDLCWFEKIQWYIYLYENQFFLQ